MYEEWSDGTTGEFFFLSKKKKIVFKILKYTDEIECEMDTGTEVKLMYGYYLHFLGCF